MNTPKPHKPPFAIEVNHLYFSYSPKIPTLRDLCFQVPQGAFVGIFGPNGGGKTTLLKLLLGFLRPSSGAITVLEGLPPALAREKMGYVPQIRGYDLQFPITVIEVVLHGLFSKHKGWGNFSSILYKKAYESLEKVGMIDKAKASFATLSGGQAQRVLIARALASDPKILLLDEATVGIDPNSLKEILDIILREKGKITTLLVTHQLQDILKEMDFLLCINETLSTYTPDLVCKHFSLGLYHPPLKPL